MFLELLATVIAGIAAAGVVMLLNRLTGRRLPGWCAPTGAGLAMVAMTISMEYSWYGRTVAALPEGITVAQSVEKQSFYQPWTYVVPYVNQFVAIDRATMKRHPALPDRRIADLYFFGRWSPLRTMPVAFDCGQGRRAILGTATQFGQNGEILNADWVDVGPDDLVLDAACEVS